MEVEAQGARLVIDLLGDASGVVALPQLAPAKEEGSVAGLVTHLHRDHTDAGALARALVPGAPVLHPPHGGGDDHENFWVAQGDAEIDAHRLDRHEFEWWEGRDVGPFRVTALPAVDSVGDPQVSWLVEARTVATSGAFRGCRPGPTVLAANFARYPRSPHEDRCQKEVPDPMSPDLGTS